MDSIPPSHYPQGNPVTSPNEAVNIPAFSPQLTGSVFFSFPPPPCVPSPANSQRFATNVVLQPSLQVNNAIALSNMPECDGNSNHHSNHYEDDKISEMTETFSNNLNLNANAPQPVNMEYAGPYSVILPPGSFVHPVGATGPTPIYQQFSPVLPASLPQVHSMYPVNVIPPKDACTNPTLVPLRPASAPECSMQAPHPQQSASVPPCLPQVPESPWSGQASAMTSNPPVYWGHYVASDNKAHPVAFGPQPFMRRHSVVDNSSVVTPTNVCPPCNLAGIVSATPEFIHPRKPDVPQWLMSPPVGEQDPSIISYAPMLYHNMRVPSLSGIAIPVVGPLGPGVSFSNAVNNMQPPKMDSPTVVVSPAPCYGIPLPPSTTVAATEHQQENDEMHEVVTDSKGNNDLQSTKDNATSEKHVVLMTPDDFLSSNLILKVDTEQKTITEELMSPTDFDSGYDSSKYCGEQTLKSSPKTLLCPTTLSDDGTCVGNRSVRERFTSLDKKRSIDKAIIANLKRAAEKLQTSPENSKSSTQKKLTQNQSEGDVATQTPSEILRSANSASLERKHSNKEEGIIRAETATQTLKLDSCCRRRNSLLYAYLLNAAVNLSAASGLLLCKHKTFSRIHKKHAVPRIHFGLGSLRCACSRKNPAAKQELQQCWQCATADDTQEIKQPTPDVFNRWPNIPPPPPPEYEEDDCQSVCSASQICADALPLAAALFPNEPVDCCHAGSQYDEAQMPPDHLIGVFWDIENCAVPTGKSALSIVQRVRDKFFTGHKEAEFMCVCDINKESRHIIQDLNNAQVNVVHINATAKNAADDKLRQSIRRFAHNHPAPATLVLITGDSNFTSEVSDLRHRHKYFVVLIHPAHASQALKQAATTVICYEQLVGDLPVVHVSPKSQPDLAQPLLLVSNLPLNNDANAIRARLRQLSENCGGKVVKLSMGTAVLKFATFEAAKRALKRIEGEDVFGYSIRVSVLRQSPNRPGRNGKNIYNSPNYSPGRNFNGVSPRVPNAPNIGMYPRQNLNATPGHPIPSYNPAFQHHPFPSVPPTMMVPPPGPFTIPPPMPPRMPPFNPTGHSPNVFHSGYNSIPVPPLPQPQLLQPPSRHPKDQPDVGVKLTVSNIDAQLGVASIQDILLNQISSYCQVLDMKVRPHNRFTVVCDVIVPCLQDASQVLQNLQRQKIGSKRVLVTLAQQNCDEFGVEDATCLKRDCFTILKDCAGKRMHLYRFFSLYEKRFQHKIKLDELRLIPDVVLFHDGPAGREIFINPNITDEQALEQHIASYPRSGRSTPDINHDFLLPVCKLHYPADVQRPVSGEKTGGLLKIEMGLREFSAKLHALLHSHNGILQLDGFEYCYCAEYGTFPFPNDMEEGGVIVEHQASYVPGVQIITSQPHCLGVKAIVWAQPQSDTGSDTASDTSGTSRWKSPNLIHFSREVVDLLKNRPYCCLPYDNFGSAYQIHFGHSCRPSDYGFTRLADLLAAIPHVLQIMGSLSNRILTLTHRAQVKRFTQEVVKILKSTPDRAILVAQMPELYNRTFNRVWKLRDYGVSVLSDLLDDIPEGHICTTGEGDNIVLSLPVRERTSDEKERTNQFAREVVKILRSRPHYRMPFTDFVPAYHRHFGRQCKLSNYGFSKLIDLFEALPNVVQVFEKGTEKHLSLTDVEQQKILSIQITSILRAQIPPAIPLLSAHVTKPGLKNDTEGPTLPLACIPALFQQKYGFPLVPQELSATDLDDLMSKLSHAINIVINKSGDKMIRLAERKPIRLLSAQLLALLLDQSADQLDVEQLHAMYMERYKESIEPHDYGFLSFSDIIKKALPGVVKMDLDAPECLIHLKPLYKEARSIRSVLLKNNGTMTMGEFNFAYLTTFHRPMDCEKLGFPTFESLLRALPNVLIVEGFGAKRTLTLRNHMQFGPLTAASMGDGKCDTPICSSASMDDIQGLDVSQPLRNVWKPKVPSCMMPFWSGQQRQNLVHSASAGNFRAGNEKGREKIVPAIGKPAPNFIPPNQPRIPYSAVHNQRYPKPRTPQSEMATSKFQSDANSTSTQTTKCTFTIGRLPVTDLPPTGKRTPVRRGVNISVITMPNGSTPIASTSSCSTDSTPKSRRSSESIDDCSEGSSCCSAENPQTPVIENYASYKNTSVSSLPSSPFARITATAYIGPLPSLATRHPASDHGSPGRIQLAASFPTLTQT